MRRYRYRHYGLTLDANCVLPRVELESSQEGDVAVEILEPGISVMDEMPWAKTAPPSMIWRAETPRGSWLRLRYSLDDAWADFSIDADGASVSVARSANVLLEEATELLIGPVFSCIAAQRGLTCVHAAVIDLDGRRIALTGPSGVGKSTIALALMQHGGALVSDDVAVLREDSGAILAAAGAPRMRVRRDCADMLVGPSASLPPVWGEGRPGSQKRYLTVDPAETAGDRSRPLDAIYLLAPWSTAATAPAIVALPPARALSRLMANRHMSEALHGSAHPRDFKLLARLIEEAPAREVLRPAGLETTAATVAAIAEDVRGLN